MERRQPGPQVRLRLPSADLGTASSGRPRLRLAGSPAKAWRGPPLVSLRFWLEHPECREKTQTGRDALVDWRRPIALEDPNCFRLASPVFSRVVSAWPFDGVDVAELYFEPDTRAEDFTPFHPSALAQFGHDPN